MDPIAQGAGSDDGELVLAARGGDGAAFARLVERYQDRVYNTCLRMCGNAADALDMTQSAFLRALQALPRFEVRSNFYTWLFRIAVNVVLSERRRQRARPTLTLHRFEEGEAVDEPVDRHVESRPEQRSERSEWRTRIAEALEKLEEEFRVAVVLKDIEELDYAEIARILHVPVGTVKSRIHRGRMMLRQLLENQEEHREFA